MSEVTELKDKVRKLRNQLSNQKRINKRLAEENRTLYKSFKDSIHHINETLTGKSVEEVMKDLKKEGEL